MSGETSFSVSNATSSETLLRGGPERQRPSDRDVATFERAMRGPERNVRERQQGGESARDGSTPDQDIDSRRLQVQTEAAVMMNGPGTAASGTIAAPATAAAPLPLDDLVAQYVQMLAVSQPAAAGSLKVMLTLDQTVLPQTELYLSKAPEGWVLQANTRSPEAYRVLSEYGSALERRFALRGLGSLSVETTMVPSAMQGR